MQVSGFAGSYVKITSEQEGDKTVEKRYFDWPAFKIAVDKSDSSKLTFDKYKETTLSQQESTVTTMVDRIVNFLKDALAVALDAQTLKELAATITATFTSLKGESDSSFLQFGKSSHKNNSAWEYRIQFAVPNPDINTYFYSLVTTIRLEADVSEESGWWGLTSSSSKNFSATIEAMELIVEQSYRHPTA